MKLKKLPDWARIVANHISERILIQTIIKKMSLNLKNGFCDLIQEMVFLKSYFQTQPRAHERY